jgi:hypothetical protein
MRNASSTTRAVTATLATGLIYVSVATAGHRPGHAPGGGGGTQPRFSVIDIPIENGFAAKLSDADPNGVITVAIQAPDEGYGSAAFAKVRRSSGAVLGYGFLPEPELVDTDGNVYENGWSSSNDVNASGVIAGYAATFHPELGPGPYRPAIWKDNGAGYSMMSLPLPAGALEGWALGINNRGDVVGHAPTDTSAVFWDAETLQPENLNTAATAALGWNLQIATDINDDRLISGIGQLDGVPRGFVLDRTTQQIWAVPLLAPAIANNAQRINSQGRVVGSMWDGDGDPFGLNPDFHPAYSWDGLGSDPEFLPSLTGNTSVALGLNDSRATVGYSIIPTDYAVEGPFADDTVATLWEPDDDGIIQPVNLRAVIPNKPERRLDFALDVNNDGWISVAGRKFHKGQYSWPAMLLVPNLTTALSSTSVPEPSTLTLLTATLLGSLSYAARRRAPTSHGPRAAG